MLNITNNIKILRFIYDPSAIKNFIQICYPKIESSIQKIAHLKIKQVKVEVTHPISLTINCENNTLYEGECPLIFPNESLSDISVWINYIFKFLNNMPNIYFNSRSYINLDNDFYDLNLGTHYQCRNFYKKHIMKYGIIEDKGHHIKYELIQKILDSNVSNNILIITDNLEKWNHNLQTDNYLIIKNRINSKNIYKYMFSSQNIIIISYEHLSLHLKNRKWDIIIMDNFNHIFSYTSRKQHHIVDILLKLKTNMGLIFVDELHKYCEQAYQILYQLVFQSKYISDNYNLHRFWHQNLIISLAQSGLDSVLSKNLVKLSFTPLEEELYQIQQNSSEKKLLEYCANSSIKTFNDSDACKNEKVCFICLEPTKMQTQTQCHHSACFTCLYSYIFYQHRKNNKCPICKTNLEVENFTTEFKHEPKQLTYGTKIYYLVNLLKLIPTKNTVIYLKNIKLYQKVKQALFSEKISFGDGTNVKIWQEKLDNTLDNIDRVILLELDIEKNHIVPETKEFLNKLIHQGLSKINILYVKDTIEEDLLIRLGILNK